MPVTVTDRTYNTWANGSNTYASLEAAPTYGILAGATLLIQRTLPSSGVVTFSRTRFLSVGGSLAPSGALPRQTTHKLQGVLSPIGAVFRGLNRSLSGGVAPTGSLALRRSLLRSYAGTLAPTGTVAPRQQLLRSFGGIPYFNGALTAVRLLRRSYAGSLASSGLVLIGKIFTRSFSSTLHPSGTLALVKTLRRAFGGVLAPSGALTYRKALKVFYFTEGRLWAWGDLRLELRKGYWPPLTTLPPGAPPVLVGGVGTKAPLLMLVQVKTPPAAGSVPTPAAPYAVPASKPEWPPLHAKPD